LPKMLKKLASTYQEKIKWGLWRIYYADERVVPLSSPDSNHTLCKKEFYDLVGPLLLEDNIHHIYKDLPGYLHQLHLETTEIGDLNPEALAQAGKDKVVALENDGFEDVPDRPIDVLEELADAYEKLLIKEFASKNSVAFPVFDLVLLGMGPDGHTASLFPDHELLDEEDRWVAPIDDSPKPPPVRLTLTYPVINHAARVAFVATGAPKKDILKRVFDLKEGLPCSRVRPVSPGTVVWFVDDAASANVAYPKTSGKA